jgi:hypothetical protein
MPPKLKRSIPEPGLTTATAVEQYLDSVEGKKQMAELRNRIREEAFDHEIKVRLLILAELEATAPMVDQEKARSREEVAAAQSYNPADLLSRDRLDQVKLKRELEALKQSIDQNSQNLMGRCEDLDQHIKILDDQHVVIEQKMEMVRSEMGRHYSKDAIDSGLKAMSAPEYLVNAQRIQQNFLLSNANLEVKRERIMQKLAYADEIDNFLVGVEQDIAAKEQLVASMPANLRDVMHLEIDQARAYVQETREKVAVLRGRAYPELARVNIAIMQNVTKERDERARLDLASRQRQEVPPVQKEARANMMAQISAGLPPFRPLRKAGDPSPLQKVQQQEQQQQQQVTTGFGGRH